MDALKIDIEKITIETLQKIKDFGIDAIIAYKKRELKRFVMEAIEEFNKKYEILVMDPRTEWADDIRIEGNFVTIQYLYQNQSIRIPVRANKEDFLEDIKKAMKVDRVVNWEGIGFLPYLVLKAEKDRGEYTGRVSIQKGAGWDVDGNKYALAGILGYIVIPDTILTVETDAGTDWLYQQVKKFNPNTRTEPQSPKSQLRFS